jgi:predicted nucleic acid-binding protein
MSAKRHAMGIDVLTQIEAWKVYKRLASDDRIQFLPEPLGIERAWYELTTFGQPATNLWTDAYLQAFGRLRGAQVVTFDRGFSRFSESEALVLGL